MSNTIKFVEGQYVSVFEPKGLRNKKSGLGTSERLGQDGGPDVLPTEQLKVVKKLGSTEAWCEREDGTQIRVHLNHINPSAKYSVSKRAPKADANMSPADKVAALKAQLAAAQQALDDAQIDLEMAREEAKGEVEESMAESA